MQKSLYISEKWLAFFYNYEREFTWKALVGENIHYENIIILRKNLQIAQVLEVSNNTRRNNL